VYLLSKEIYHSPLRESFGSGSLNLQLPPQLSELFSVWEPFFAQTRHFDIELYQHAYRVDTHSGRITGNWPFSGSEVAIFTPDLRHLYYSVSVAVAGGELDLRCLNLGTGKEDDFRYSSNVPYPHCFSFSANGHVLAIGGQHYSGDGNYYVHRLDVWHRTELEPFQTDPMCIAYAPDKLTLLATGDTRDGVKTCQGRKLAEQWSHPASALVWGYCGELGWGHGDRLVVARPGSGELIREMAALRGAVLSLAFSPDGKLLLAGSDQGVCSYFEPESGRITSIFDWGIGPVHSVAFSPDGLTCAAGGEKGQVVVWDVDA
jgi:WD40 repeat protein